MSTAFVFLHVGSDATLPSLLVKSLRALHPDAEIIQCTDGATPAVDGIDTLYRHDADTTNLMTFRLESFAALGRREPALYLDTDMLCVEKLDPAAMLGSGAVAACSREFHRDDLINPRFRNMDLGEYAGKTLAEVYPYVACTTVATNSEFWADCHENLRSLAAKFHFWYGDQEAMRNVLATGRYPLALLPESIYGCLPDERMPDRAHGEARPRLLHFKGAARKPMMFEVARRMRLA